MENGHLPPTFKSQVNVNANNLEQYSQISKKHLYQSGRQITVSAKQLKSSLSIPYGNTD